MKKLLVAFTIVVAGSFSVVACGSAKTPCEQLADVCIKCTGATKVGCDATVALGNQTACSAAKETRALECK